METERLTVETLKSGTAGQRTLIFCTHNPFSQSLDVPRSALEVELETRSSQPCKEPY